MLTCGLAAATQLPATITVDRGPGAEACSDRADLAARVEGILQRMPGETVETGELGVNVHFSRDGAGYVAEVQVRGTKLGERVLRDPGPGCAALSGAVSVAIALLLDSELRERTPPPAAAAPPTVTRPAPVRRHLAPQPGPEIWVTVGGGLALGLVGSPSIGLEGAVGLRLADRWILEGAASALVPREHDTRTGSVEVGLVFGSIRGCYRFGSGLGLGPCALFGVGQRSGGGEGYAEDRSAKLLWTAAGIGLLAEARIGRRWSTGLLGTLWIPTRRQEFTVQNAGMAWESSPVGGTLDLRIGLRP
jgi:hypothetical protein